jgi:hypothetical protein
MKNVRLSVCLLVSITLLMLGGCTKISKTSRPPRDIDVRIDNCVATPPSVDVYEGDRVHWQPVDRDYTISFLDAAEPTRNPFKVRHGGDLAHPIKGHSRCRLGNINYPDPNKHDYYCDYTITSDQPPPCPNDPGVHIIPN